MFLKRKIIGLAIALSVISTLEVKAQTQTPVAPGPHPLENNIRDPLLPEVSRPLNPVERSLILQTTEQLDQQAKKALEAGKEVEAFNLWYRELKLQRALGLAEELLALNRVGGIAWDKNRTVDLEAINRRLEEIEPQVTTPQLLNSLAEAYRQIRNLDKSIEVYQKILINAQTQQDVKTEQLTLENIGKLELARFDYKAAANTYEKLLALSQGRDDIPAKEIYLQQLAIIYTQGLEPTKAVAIKEQLAESYLKTQQEDKIPALKISLGDDYQANNQPQEASQRYQQAFELALSLEQFATASEALEKLGNLYQKNNEGEAAIKIYQQLLTVQKQSSNLFGLMTTYDRLAQIYLDQQNYANALQNLQKGLETAKTLNYQQSYFNDQIEKVKSLIKK